MSSDLYLVEFKRAIRNEEVGSQRKFDIILLKGPVPCRICGCAKCFEIYNLASRLFSSVSTCLYLLNPPLFDVWVSPSRRSAAPTADICLQPEELAAGGSYIKPQSDFFSRTVEWTRQEWSVSKAASPGGRLFSATSPRKWKWETRKMLFSKNALLAKSLCQIASNRGQQALFNS